MKSRFQSFIYAVFLSISMLNMAHAELKPEDLLSPEEAFVPTLEVSEQGVKVNFKVADGYYLYKSKIVLQSSLGDVFRQPEMSTGKAKEDEFFGKQEVYYHQAQGNWAFKHTPNDVYTLTLQYQGCADVGVCYPPAENQFEINKNGVYGVAPDENDVKAIFTKKPSDTAKPAASSTVSVDEGQFALSRDTLGVNLLAFFVAGLGLSLTACLYPLLPIVSSIIVGDKSSSKKRAFILSFVYVQGLAVTYTLVGVIAGLTGALLTVWLQQAWVVLLASALMVVLALSMFGLFNIQLPTAIQSYFQNQSNQLSGGKVASVFAMGMLSALIVGPCVAPPLALALGYIGKTGDAVLGGMALYAMAMGTGVPLLIVGTFGGHVLPRAGNWMNGIKCAFGVILLAVAVYLATPFLPYAVTVALYVALMIVPALWIFYRSRPFSGSLKGISHALATALLVGGMWFGIQSVRGQETVLHDFLTLHQPNPNAIHAQKFTDVAQLKSAMDKALQEDPNTPILLDFYADWCVSCKEMEAKTFNHADVQAAVPMSRMFQIDVTANTAEHQALLKEYGLFGPPSLFILKADGSRSDGLLGYLPADKFIAWYRARQ